MKVQRISEDDWHGLTSQDQEYSCVGKEQALTAIRKLNGANKTMVELIVNEELFLTVGGGNDGRYICYLTEGEKILTLLSSSTGDRQVNIVAGGQPGFYDLKFSLEIDSVIQAADFFCEHGTQDPQQNWEQST